MQMRWWCQRWHFSCGQEEDEMARTSFLGTHVSGNSTGLVFILLCKARMYSSINGHCRESRGKPHRRYIELLLNQTQSLSLQTDRTNYSGSIQPLVFIPINGSETMKVADFVPTDEPLAAVNKHWTGAETSTLPLVEQMLIDEWETEKVRTCLPEDEAVEGDSHGPHIQRLEEKDSRDNISKSKDKLNTYTEWQRSVNQCRLPTAVWNWRLFLGAVLVKSSEDGFVESDNRPCCYPSFVLQSVFLSVTGNPFLLLNR